MNRRITLVNPPAEVVRECYDTPNYPHIGIAYVAGYLQSNGHDVDVVDGKLARLTLAQTIDEIVDQRPRVLGLTAMTHEIATADKIARRVHELLPDTTIVLGGFHGTFLPERTLREFPEFDYIIVGEGEIAFLEFVETLFAGSDPSTIQGVASVLKGDRGEGAKVSLNGRGKTADDLDDLGMPAWDLFPKAEMYPIMTQRGCPFGCNFCSRPYGRKVRQRSASHVAAELRRSVDKYNCKHVDFYDETFTVRRDYVSDVCEAIIEEGLDRELTFWSYVHANTVDLPTAKKMKAAGFREVGFGVESGNVEIMKQMRKGVTREDVIRAANIFRQAKLRFGAYFIIGHPNETKRTVLDTIDLAVKLNPDSVAFGIMTPYPGTEIWEMAIRGDGGYKMLSMKWEDFNKQIGSALELENLTRRQMEMLQLRGYLTVYIKNLRFKELFQAIGINYKRIAFILRKLLVPSGKAASASWLDGASKQPATAP